MKPSGISQKRIPAEGERLLGVGGDATKSRAAIDSVGVQVKRDTVAVSVSIKYTYPPKEAFGPAYGVARSGPFRLTSLSEPTRARRYVTLQFGTGAKLKGGDVRHRRRVAHFHAAPTPAPGEQWAVGGAVTSRCGDVTLSQRPLPPAIRQAKSERETDDIGQTKQMGPSRETQPASCRREADATVLKRPPAP
ncbi:unnamed protein product, partial [Iphiclides podalirius]